MESLNKTRETIDIQCSGKYSLENRQQTEYIHWLKTLPKSTTVENTAGSVTKNLRNCIYNVTKQVYL